MIKYKYYYELIINIKKILGIEITEDYYNFIKTKSLFFMYIYYKTPDYFLVNNKKDDIIRLETDLKTLTLFMSVLFKRQKYLIQKLDNIPDDISKFKLEIIENYININKSSINNTMFIYEYIKKCNSNEPNWHPTNLIYNVYETEQIDENYYRSYNDEFNANVTPDECLEEDDDDKSYDNIFL